MVVTIYMVIYSIREIEEITGIKAHTLRIWEKRYDIVTPHRTQTNIRYYTEKELKEILNISFLNKNGFKISHIAKLSESEILTEIDSLFSQYVNERKPNENFGDFSYRKFFST